MAHEEEKLDRMRRKIALNEMKMLRGQTAVHETDLMAEFRELDNSDQDSDTGMQQPGTRDSVFKTEVITCKTVHSGKDVWIRRNSFWYTLILPCYL